MLADSKNEDYYKNENQIVKCEFCGFTFRTCDGISCD